MAPGCVTRVAQLSSLSLVGLTLVNSYMSFTFIRIANGECAYTYTAVPPTPPAAFDKSHCTVLDVKTQGRHDMSSCISRTPGKGFLTATADYFSCWVINSHSVVYSR
jgi:hypothetical protein